jgi:hypothetical protein
MAALGWRCVLLLPFGDFFMSMKQLQLLYEHVLSTLGCQPS